MKCRYLLLIRLALIICLSKLVSTTIPDHFVTNEKEAIEYGRETLKTRLQQPPKKKWLCVTYMKGSQAELDIIMKNAHILPCEWAVIFYSHLNESQYFQSKICNSLRKISTVRHCQSTTFNSTKLQQLTEEYTTTSAYKLVNHTNDKEAHFIGSRSFNLSDTTFLVPKLVMYIELLPYLSDYRDVIMMDSDMLFVTKEFNLTQVETILQRGYKYPIKVSQPCIIGPSSFHTFHQDRWINYTHVAIGIDFVEQQSYFVNSLVLEWAIRTILSKTIDYHSIYQSNWGFDNVLCRAAKTFSELVLGESMESRRNNPVCVILTRHCVRHENTKTIKKTSDFKTAGNHMLHYYHKFFPHWYFDFQTDFSTILHWETRIEPPLY